MANSIEFKTAVVKNPVAKSGRTATWDLFV